MPDLDEIEHEELDGEMTAADILEILQGLRFGRGCRQRDAQRLISLDAEVRDFLVRSIAPGR
jgi:hypothetical protein